MFAGFFGKFSKDIAIDMGTANIRMAVKDRGLAINEPSVVAINTRTQNIVAVGTTAKDMQGKTPAHIVTTRPLFKGVISDFDVTERMLRYFIDKIHEDAYTPVPRPRMIITVPLETTEVQRKAIEDVALGAGAREIFLVESPIVSALGAGLPLEESLGNMIVDIGAGRLQIAAVSLRGIVTWTAVASAGDDLTKSVVQYARDTFSLHIGENMAEEAKWRLGTAVDLGVPLHMDLRGRHVVNGLPRQVSVTGDHIREALRRPLSTLVASIKATLETTPAELVGDIYARGIVLVGGGALLQGLDKLIARELDLPVRVAEDPAIANVRGAGMLFDRPDILADVALPKTYDA